MRYFPRLLIHFQKVLLRKSKGEVEFEVKEQNCVLEGLTM